MSIISGSPRRILHVRSSLIRTCQIGRQTKNGKEIYFESSKTHELQTIPKEKANTKELLKDIPEPVFGGLFSLV
jgi:hypothetical protein